MEKFFKRSWFMISVVADTHGIIWYFRSPDKLSPEAIIVLDGAVNNGCFIYLSAISIIEIIYLFEKNKISEVALSQLFQFLADPDIRLKVVPINLSVGKCLTKIPRLIVLEIGDRIIAATTLYLDLPLVTKDHKIRELSIIQTIWDNSSSI